MAARTPRWQRSVRVHPGAYLQVGARDSGRLDVRKDVLKVRLSQVHVGIGRVGVCSTTTVVPSVSSGSLRSIHAIDRLLDCCVLSRRAWKAGDGASGSPVLWVARLRMATMYLAPLCKRCTDATADTTKSVTRLDAPSALGSSSGVASVPRLARSRRPAPRGHRSTNRARPSAAACTMPVSRSLDMHGQPRA